MLLVALIPLTTASVAAGSTYLIASNAAGTQGSLPSQDSLIEQNLLKVPTPIPTSPVPTGFVYLTPTPTPNPTTGWPSYNFSDLSLNFNYPQGWNVVAGSASGPPYLHVRNFIATGSAALQDTSGEYVVRISRLEQVGITTINALTTQLALNATSSVSEDGVSLGTVTVATTSAGKINGYLSYGRVVTYSQNPSQQIPEVYVLDGLGNVVRAIPQLDVVGTQPYFNQVVSTFTFTNGSNN